MRGKAVFYPMGWDDNGLPTERRVQNYYGVRCDPSLPYDPSFTAPDQPPKHPISISRPNFIELCNRLTAEDEKAFERLWKHLGLSVDWSMTYSTIDARAQRSSQIAFLRLLKRGLAYQVEAPTLWDVDFRTAVAQAELEDRELSGAYHRIKFAVASGTSGAQVGSGLSRTTEFSLDRGNRDNPSLSSYPPASRSSRIQTMDGIRPCSGKRSSPRCLARESQSRRTRSRIPRRAAALR